MCVVWCICAISSGTPQGSEQSILRIFTKRSKLAHPRGAKYEKWIAFNHEKLIFEFCPSAESNSPCAKGSPTQWATPSTENLLPDGLILMEMSAASLLTWDIYYKLLYAMIPPRVTAILAPLGRILHLEVGGFGLLQFDKKNDWGRSTERGKTWNSDNDQWDWFNFHVLPLSRGLVTSWGHSPQ